MQAKGSIHIGTSGWHYPHWKGPFYPQNISSEQMLVFYAENFRVAEINNSFYQLPDKATLQKWRDAVPADFRFAVKASRYLTHMKKLKNAAAPLDNFLTRLQGLGQQLGPILFQLPPNWHCNLDRLGDFLTRLPDGYRYSFEFRDTSWFCDEVYVLLREAGAAFCIYDLAGLVSPREVTADFIYLRLHGPAEAYQGCYDQTALAGWAGAISTWARQGKEIFCFFDNDQSGYAPQNAHSLQTMLKKGE